jgi:hypothetical protein
LRPLLIDTPEALEVALLEAQVPVVGHAEGHADVGRLIALDLVAGAHDIDRDRRRERHDEEDEACERLTGTPFRRGDGVVA